MISLISNNLTLLLGFIMPLFLVLSFSFIVPPILKVTNDKTNVKPYFQRIVYEKETGVKELMKMMGLPSWMHWVKSCVTSLSLFCTLQLCWYINCALTASITIIIMVALLSVSFKVGPWFTFIINIFIH